MKRFILVALLAASLFALMLPLKFTSHAQTSTTNALILYDTGTPQYAKLGITYAIMVRNLLGHFGMGADIVPVENYTTGKIESYPVTFYLGSNYNDPIPTTFFSDIVKTKKTIVWFKYNLWEIAWATTYNFSTKFGFNFTSLQGMNAQPTASNPSPGFYDTVQYKGQNMVKYYAYDASTNTINADPDIGVTTITDATKATAVTTITNSANGSVVPYIVHSGNFWYFADMPLTFIGPRDRYLVFCDILHDILGVTHAESHKAMVRLEDVGATVDPTTMQTLSDYLSQNKIPFSIATIPFYRDPLGYWNGGVMQEIHMKDAPDLINSLNYAVSKGGTIIMHGYTHQYDNQPNITTGVSADDFEFWNAVASSPVTEDSVKWATARLDAGLSELSSNGFTPYAWECPHYQASPLAYQAFVSRFKNTYQRTVYYSSTNPNLNPNVTNHDFMAGMFFPYVINSDYYGQRIIPEDLGNVEYNISNIDPYSNVTYTWQDIVTNAQYAKVVRDGYASFFFHPFWLESDLSFLNAYQDFQNLVQGITAQGYTWVDVKNQ
jgi:uncharacterized protein YdaL